MGTLLGILRGGSSTRNRGSKYRRLSLMRRREELVGWLFVSPWVLGFLALTLGPMVASFYLSFHRASMLSPSVFVGLANYQTLLSRDEIQSLLWKTLYNTSYYVFFSVPLKTALAFGLAVMLNQSFRGRGLFRTIYYLPSIVPPVAGAALWLWVFHRDFGILNSMLRLIGIQGPPWLTSVVWAKPALVIMSLWQAGGGLLILLAGLQGVPTELHDAAKVDGAAAWSRFWHITVPIMTPTLFFVLVTEIISSFQVFVVTWVMTDGGPVNTTLMYVLWLYRLAFQQFKMGYASALAWVYFAILMAFAALIFKSSSAWVYYEGKLMGGKR